jgi:subtilisin family serine protease
MAELIVQAAAGGEMAVAPAPDEPGEAWAQAYAEARRPSVAWAAPEAIVRAGDPLAPMHEPARAPGDRGWAVERVRAPQARSLVPADAEPPWIGHADTGWGRHPQVPRERLDLEHALDAFTGAPDAEDPLGRLDLFDGHGTGTLSVLIAAGGDAPDALQGVSPDATVTPVRCANSVVLFSDLALTRAIDHLSTLGVGVITISLGGLPSAPLRDALLRAVARQVVVVAAGGQRFPIVPYPARYEECIAVGACGPDDRPWKSTTDGRQIAVCAPGHDVVVADFGPQRSPVVRAGSGTSYAAPHVAGAAALWLQYHGRDRLLARYASAQPLQSVFRELLTRSARRPDGWRTDRYGAGILDVEALLEAPLPEPRAARAARALTPAEHDLAALADVLAVQPVEAAAVVRGVAHVSAPELPVAASEMLRSVLSLPGESVGELRALEGPDLQRAIAPAIAPAASPHLAQRLR